MCVFHKGAHFQLVRGEEKVGSLFPQLSSRSDLSGARSSARSGGEVLRSTAKTKFGAKRNTLCFETDYQVTKAQSPW